MTETNKGSLRIRLIPAVQESDQDQDIDQDSESSARRPTRQVKDGKKIQLRELKKDPLMYGKPVNDGRGIQCNLCQAVLKAYSQVGDTRGIFKHHLGM